MREAQAAVLAGALAAGGLPALEELNLDDNLLQDVGVARLADALGSGAGARLRVLGLENNEVGEEGARALARMLRAGRVMELREINLEGNPLGGGCAALVSALADGCAPRLENLDLEDTGLDEPAARALAAGIRAGQLPQLHLLHCRENPQIGEGAKGELRAAMEPLLQMPPTSEKYRRQLLI